MTGNKRQNFIGGAAVLASAVAVTKVLGALYKIPLGNLLDSEGMAHFYVAYNIYNLLLLLSTAGLPLALSRLVSEAGALGRENEKRRIFHVALGMFAVLGFVGGGAMLLYPEALANLLHDSLAAPAIRALAPSVLCVSLLSAIRGYTQGQGDMKPTAVSQIIESACKLVVGLTLAWWLLGGGAPSHIAAAGAIAGVTVGSVLALLVLSVQLLFWGPRKRGTDVPLRRRVIARELMRIGVPITIGAAGMSAITLLDQTLIMSTLQGTLGYSERVASTLYGEYTFGMTLFSLPASFIYPVTVSLIPAIGSALARRDERAACRHTESAFRLTALLSMPAGVGLAVLARPILDLLYPAVPETAAAAAYHLTVLGVACIGVCLMIVTNGVLQAYGREYVPVWSLLCGGVVKIIVNQLLVADPAIGIKGAPIGTLCCYGLIALINLVVIRRTLPHRPGYLRTFARPALATAAMAVVASGTWRFLALGLHMGHAATLVSVGIAAFVYGLSCLWLGAVTREDILSLPKGEKIADFFKIGTK